MMAIKVVDDDGQEYEFRGKYGNISPGMYFLSVDGTVSQHNRNNNPGVFGIRAILHPIRKRHTFGGIVFEETGEVRTAEDGEWWLGPLNKAYCGKTYASWKILRPVAIE